MQIVLDHDEIYECLRTAVALKTDHAFPFGEDDYHLAIEDADGNEVMITHANFIVTIPKS